MAEAYIQDKTIEREDFEKKPLDITGTHFEDCHFRQCNFSGADLREIRFYDCSFDGCNMSLVKLDQTIFQQVDFRGCKMLGLHFELCNHFGFNVQFTECQLNHSSFYGLKMPKTRFERCTLKGADFTNTDLTSAVFSDCDLLDGKFTHTVLVKADFSSAINYSLDPEENRIKKAKFSRDGLHGLLTKYQIDIH